MYNCDSQLDSHGNQIDEDEAVLWWDKVSCKYCVHARQSGKHVFQMLILWNGHKSFYLSNKIVSNNRPV